MKMMMGGLLGAALVVSPVPTSAAAVLKTNAQGKLIGATGVIIGKLTYNVDFADGTCIAIYGACSVANFQFKTKEAALAAGNALLSQVLIGNYIRSPGSVFGCGTSTCDTFIPYGIYQDYPDTVEAVVVANRGTGSRFVAGTVYPAFDQSTALDPNVNYARFTLQVAAVPEPATWAMMLVGFGMVGAASRYRRRGAKVTYA